MRKLTENEVAELAPFEERFRTAINADWARHPGVDGLKTIHTIYAKASGDISPVNANCSHCIVRLLKSAGRMYFEAKEALAHKVEVAEGGETKPKVALKTRKRK